MASPRTSFPIFGVLLIIVGVALLLDRLAAIHFGWNRIFWATMVFFGGAMVVRAFMDNVRRGIFFGTVIFLFGLLFLLRSFHLVEGRFHLFFPATFIILGFAFLVLFVFDPQDWHLLIPTGIFLSLGIVFMLTELEYFDRWEIWYTLKTWWPLVLILIGLSMILRRRSVRKID